MGQQTADRRKQKAGRLSAWEKPEAVVQLRGAVDEAPTCGEHDEAKEQVVDDEHDVNFDSDFDSETDSESEIEEDDETESVAHGQPSTGRGGRRGRASEQPGSADLGMEEVDILVELEHSWRRSQARA